MEQTNKLSAWNIGSIARCFLLQKGDDIMTDIPNTKGGDYMGQMTGDILQILIGFGIFSGICGIIKTLF